MNKKSCLYARVSKTDEAQDTSYHNQQKIKLDGYEIVKTYADRGTGTQVKNRKQFKQMIYDCGVDIERVEDTNIYNFIPRDREPMYDAIIVSHTSRFIRNQLMMKSCINALRSKNVEIFFVDLGKSSLDKDIDFIMNILFLLDEQESQNISMKVRKGMQRSRDEKKYIQVSKMFGYDYIKEENRLVINEQEAEVVRKIFSMYLDGCGYRKIFDCISEKYPQYDKKISQIACILKNEKYCGYNAYGKWSVNKMEGIKKKNREYEIFPTDRIEPIISFEDWSKAQEIIKSKSSVNRGVKRSMYPLSQKIVCGVCGKSYIRQTETKGNYKRVFWVCREKKMYGNSKCCSVAINEKKLPNLITSDDFGIRALIKRIELQVQIVLKDMQKIDTSNVENELKLLKLKQERLFDSYVDGIVPKDIYNRKQLELAEEEKKLLEQLECATDKNTAIEDVRILSETFKDKLEGYYTLMNDGSYEEVYKNIDKIVLGIKTVQINEDEFKVEPVITELKFKGFESLNKLFEGSILKL